MILQVSIFLRILEKCCVQVVLPEELPERGEERGKGFARGGFSVELCRESC